MIDSFENVADIADGQKMFEWKALLREREVFETNVSNLACALAKERIASYTGPVSAKAADALFKNLTRRLAADQVLAEELAGLQSLAVCEESIDIRLAALDRGVSNHLPEAVRDVLPGARLFVVDRSEEVQP